MSAVMDYTRPRQCAAVPSPGCMFRIFYGIVAIVVSSRGQGMATSAERMRRHRDRHRRGVLAVVPVEVYQDDLDALIAVGGVPYTHGLR